MPERLPPTTWAPLARGAALVAPFVAGVVLYALRDHITSATGVLVRRGRPVDVDRVGLPTDEYAAIAVS